MTLGGYLAARTERDVIAQRIATEKLEIRTEPDEERAELREIYRAKGLEGTLLEDVVADLTSTKERWLAAMIRDEHGIVTSERENPLSRGIRVGGAFVLGGLVPVIPFALHLPHARWLAFGLTALVARTRSDEIALHGRWPRERSSRVRLDHRHWHRGRRRNRRDPESVLTPAGW